LSSGDSIKVRSYKRTDFICWSKEDIVLWFYGSEYDFKQPWRASAM